MKRNETLSTLSYTIIQLSVNNKFNRILSYKKYQVQTAVHALITVRNVSILIVQSYVRRLSPLPIKNIRLVVHVINEILTIERILFYVFPFALKISLHFLSISRFPGHR